jgi:hypothetical protein
VANAWRHLKQKAEQWLRPFKEQAIQKANRRKETKEDFGLQDTNMGVEYPAVNIYDAAKLESKAVEFPFELIKGGVKESLNLGQK